MARLGVKGAVIGGVYVPGDIAVSDGRVDQVGLPPGRGGFAIPGFVDLQVNGYAGVDFTVAAEDEWLEASRRLAQSGTTRFLANLITSEQEVIEKALAVARNVSNTKAPGRATLGGVHLEGPFLAEPKAGIHPKAHLLAPDWSLLQRWMQLGPIAMATIAPELPGAIDIVSKLRESGVVVSLGHSQASYQEAIAGFNAGAATVTHLFNAMSGVTAREPGLTGAALSRTDVWLQLIVDLLHVDRVLVELVGAVAPERVVAVTDCLPTSGTSEAHLSFGGTRIDVVDGRAASRDGILAGSVVQMDQALRNAVSCGMSVVNAVNATSRNPLAVLNYPIESLLAPGDVADVLIVSDSLDLENVFLSGVDIHMQEVG